MKERITKIISKGKVAREINKKQSIEICFKLNIQKYNARYRKYTKFS